MTAPQYQIAVALPERREVSATLSGPKGDPGPRGEPGPPGPPGEPGLSGQQVIEYDAERGWPERPDAPSVRWVGGTEQPPGMTSVDVWETPTDFSGVVKWRKDSYTATGIYGATITLGATPAGGSMLLTRNGSILIEGADYSVDGTALTLTASTAGDLIAGQYAYTDDQPAAAWSVHETLLITDSFDRPDSATTLGATEMGQPWIVPVNFAGSQPVAGISGGAAYFADTTADHYAIVDTGVSDCTVQIKFIGPHTNCGLYVRATDASNGYTTNRKAVYRRVNGNNTASGGLIVGYFNGSTADLFQDGDTMRIVLNGPSIKVYRQAASTGDFVLVLDATDDYPDFQANTLHGFRSGEKGNSDLRFDDFRVIA